MNCPKCQSKDTRVLDSRLSENNKAVRRRRECESCKFRFTTFERVEFNNFVVVKKDGTRENYDRLKVENGIWRACQKRKVTQENVNEILNKLEEKWNNYGKEVPSEVIGEGIMEALLNLDEVAYIRFASVYKEFKDLETFQKELQKILER